MRAAGAEAASGALLRLRPGCVVLRVVVGLLAWVGEFASRRGLL